MPQTAHLQPILQATAKLSRSDPVVKADRGMGFTTDSKERLALVACWERTGA